MLSDDLKLALEHILNDQFYSTGKRPMNRPKPRPTARDRNAYKMRRYQALQTNKERQKELRTQKAIASIGR